MFFCFFFIVGVVCGFVIIYVQWLIWFWCEWKCWWMKSKANLTNQKKQIKRTKACVCVCDMCEWVVCVQLWVWKHIKNKINHIQDRIKQTSDKQKTENENTNKKISASSACVLIVLLLINYTTIYHSSRIIYGNLVIFDWWSDFVCYLDENRVMFSHSSIQR